MIQVSDMTCRRCRLVNSPVNAEGECGLCSARANETPAAFWNLDDVRAADLYALGLALAVFAMLLLVAPWGTR